MNYYVITNENGKINVKGFSNLDDAEILYEEYASWPQDPADIQVRAMLMDSDLRIMRDFYQNSCK